VAGRQGGAHRGGAAGLRHRERARHEVLAVERRLLGDAVDFRLEGRDFGIDALGIGRADGAVGGFDGQFTDALEHRVDFGQGAFCRLDHRDAVL